MITCETCCPLFGERGREESAFFFFDQRMDGNSFLFGYSSSGIDW